VLRIERDTLTMHGIVVERSEDLSKLLLNARHDARVLRIVLVDGYDDEALSRVLWSAFDAKFREVAMNYGRVEGAAEIVLPLDLRRKADAQFVVWFDAGLLRVFDFRGGTKPHVLAQVRPGDAAAETALHEQLATTCTCGTYRAAIELGQSAAPGSLVSALESWARITESLPTVSSSLGFVSTVKHRLHHRSRLATLVVGRIFQSQVTPLRACFDLDPTRADDLARPLVVAFVVQQDGSVRDVKSRPGTLANEVALACVLRTIAGMEFPTPGEEPLSVTYPLIWSEPAPRVRPRGEPGTDGVRNEEPSTGPGSAAR
jgi:hypothetical protein